MKEWRGWVLPDGEDHLPQWMTTMNDVRDGRPTYQANKYDASMAIVRHRRVAVDIGANVGLWSWLMVHDFDQVHSFEPVAEYAACWRKNVQSQRAHLHQVALGERACTVSMTAVTNGSCGDTTVDVGQGGCQVAAGVGMRTLDSYRLTEVDLIKADNEGYEVFALRGARETISRCRPVIVVEQKPGHGAAFGVSDTAAVDFLVSIGMQVRQVINGDYILDF